MGFPSSIRLNLILVVLAGVLPMLAVILFSGIERRDKEIRYAQETTLRLAETYAYMQESELDRIKNVLATLAQTPEVQAVDEEACNALFRDYLGANPNYANFALIGVDGFAVSSALPFEKPKDLSDRKEIIEALATGDFSVGEYSIGRVSGLQILPVAYPAYDADGEMICILIASLKLEEYATIFQQANLPAGSFVGLVDHQGRRLYRYPEDGREIGTPIPEIVWSHLTAIDRAGMFSAQDSTGRNLVFAVRRIGITEGSVPHLNIVVAIPESILIEGADGVTAMYFRWGGLAVALSVLLAWMIGHYAIYKRLAKLASVADRLGAGDLNARSGMTPLRGSIGTLASVFDRMAGALEQYVRDLEKAKQDAERSDKAKTEFLANMSHEVRTPLNGIIGMLHLLGMAQLTDEQKQFVQYASQSSKRLTTLLSDILDVSRVEAGKLECLSEPFEFRDAMLSVEHLFIPVARQEGLDFSVSIDPAIPDRLRGDTTRLQQILSNLVGNSLKFTEHGAVALEAWSLPAAKAGHCRLLFAVSDTGAGIPDDKLEGIFESFSQVGEGYTRKNQGAGLGLTIVKRLVSLLGGTICVASEKGVGTTFYVSLPYLVESAPQAEAEEPDAAAESRGLAILLAEDDMVTQIATTKLLEGKGHQVKTTVDGEKALAELRTGSYDLVLMDVQMPNMDGITATRLIREGEAGEKNKDIPIIAMTAYAMSNDKGKFLQQGMDDYLSKPVQLQDLDRALQRAALGRTARS